LFLIYSSTLKAREV